MPDPGCAFDHCILAVHDISRVSSLLERLGFTLSPPGRHPSRGTVNACVMLPNGYLELLAADGPACIETFLLEFLAVGEGLCSLAFAPDSSARLHGLLGAWGAANGEPVIGSRAMRTPDGTREVRFRVCRVSGQPVLPGRVFFCEHLDRETVYAPYLLRHANGATGIAGMTVVGDPALVLDASRAAALGLGRMTADGDVVLHAGSVAIRITPRHGGTRRPPGQMSAPELRLRLLNTDAVARAAAAEGLVVAVDADGAVRIAVHGVDLVLAA
jgi:hypothetical protein